MNIPFLTRLLEIKEQQMQEEIRQTMHLKDISDLLYEINNKINPPKIKRK